MAWVEPSTQNGRFKISFRWHGKKYRKTVAAKSLREAEGIARRVDENISLAERGRLKIPDGADVAAFLLSDGEVVVATEAISQTPAKLSDLIGKYLATHSQGAMEANSLATARLHLRHFEKSLRAETVARKIKLADVQKHVDRRAKKTYRGKPLSPVTLRKEVASIRAAWNWGARMGLVEGPFPGKDVVYPKGDEKPPFMTREMIERRVAQGGLDEREVRQLWECLFLTKAEIAEFLAFAKQAARPAFLYPLLCFAAHTGARRSELVRVEVADVDFTGGLARIREKKRDHRKRSFRRVPLSSFLVGVLRDWLAIHPGGPTLFSQGTVVARSKKRKLGKPPVQGPLTRDELHHYLQDLVASSSWGFVRGWHCLRHSFISACVADGVDQRLLMSWVGHVNEQTHKRYVHFAPSNEQTAIRRVFG